MENVTRDLGNLMTNLTKLEWNVKDKLDDNLMKNFKRILKANLRKLGGIFIKANLTYLVKT